MKNNVACKKSHVLRFDQLGLRRVTALIVSLMILESSGIPLANAAKKEMTVESFEKELLEKRKRFDKAHESARAALLKQFDQAISRVSRMKGTAQQKIAQLEELKRLRLAFETSESLPVSDEYVSDSIAYCEKVFRATVPLRQFFEKQLQQNFRDDGLRERIQYEYETWNAQLPSSDSLTDQAKWHGRRVFRGNGSAVDFHIHVDNCDGDTFSGSVWQETHNACNRAGLAFVGQYTGNRVQLRTTKTLRGKPRRLVLTGFVVEGRMILTVTGTSKSGRSIRSDFVTVRKN
jgi:hypothetical protein